MKDKNGNDLPEVRFELIQIEQNYRSGISVFIPRRTLFIIGRNDKLEKKIFFVNDFFPRFQVEKGENMDLIVNEYKSKIKEIKDKNIRKLGGKIQLLSIYTYKTDDVVDIRDAFSITYDANITFTEVFKRKKLIRGYFYIPEYIFDMKSRDMKIRGINYIFIKSKEINGGKLEF